MSLTHPVAIARGVAAPAVQGEGQRALAGGGGERRAGLARVEAHHVRGVGKAAAAGEAAHGALDVLPARTAHNATRHTLTRNTSWTLNMSSCYRGVLSNTFDDQYSKSAHQALLFRGNLIGLF